MNGAYVKAFAKEPFLVHAHISPYKCDGANKGYNPERERKLLMNKSEIRSLIGKEKGTVIIPLEIVEAGHSLVKLKIGVGHGKKKYDKRKKYKKREVERRGFAEVKINLREI